MIGGLHRVRDYVIRHRMELVKFGVVGVITFFINFFGFALFFKVFHFDYRIAATISYIITVVSHFLLNRFLTFRAGGQNVSHNVVRYAMMLGLNYGITLAAMTVTVELIGASPYWGVILSTACTASTSFFVMKYFVFGLRKTSWQS